MLMKIFLDYSDSHFLWIFFAEKLSSAAFVPEYSLCPSFLHLRVRTMWCAPQHLCPSQTSFPNSTELGDAP